jgi:hypothetical protein
MFVDSSYAPGQKLMNTLQDQRRVSFVLIPVSLKCWQIDGTSYWRAHFKYQYFGVTQFLNAALSLNSCKMKSKIVSVLNSP